MAGGRGGSIELLLGLCFGWRGTLYLPLIVNQTYKYVTAVHTTSFNLTEFKSSDQISHPLLSLYCCKITLPLT